MRANFPDVPHRSCDNHFLRDLAKPVLEADSHAKVQMRKKVRGLRGIEKQVLEDRRQAQAQAEAARVAGAADEPVAGTASEPARVEPPVGDGPPAAPPAAEAPDDETGQVV